MRPRRHDGITGSAGAWSTMKSMHQGLTDHGYVLLKGLLSRDLARVLYKAMLLGHWRDEHLRDNHMPTSSSTTNRPLTDALLLELQPRVEEVAGAKLVPTYSFARVYFHGDTLVRHVDRGACEVSVSINLGQDGGNSGLWFHPGVEVLMEEGDGAVYLGCEASHWREPFAGEALGQIFLHYVRRDGTYADQYFDRHPDRFPPSITQGLVAAG